MKKLLLSVLFVLTIVHAGCAQSISSGALRATLDEDGVLTLEQNGKVWLTAPFAVGDTSRFHGEPLPADNPFGKGRMLVDSDSGTRILLLENTPFVYIRRDARNCAVAAPSKSINALDATLELGAGAQERVGSGPNGLFKPDKNPGQHLFTAIANPETNRGVVAGLVKIDAVSPVVFTKVVDGKVELILQDQYGAAVPPALDDFGGDWWVVGLFDDARAGLELYADEFARINKIKMKRLPVGLMTWYCEKYGGALNQDAVIEIAEYIKKTFGDYGYDFIQIDDLWQNGIKTNGPAKDFSKVRPDGPYKDGMKGPAEKLDALGFTPGLWLLPFGTNEKDPDLQRVNNFIVRTPDGKPFTTNWSGTAIDASHPDGRAYVREMMRRTVQDWGYRYLKLDGIHMAMASRQIYPRRYFVQDDFGDAVFHDKNMSNMQVGRLGLDTIREGAGPDTFILGCTSTQNERSLAMCLGKFDAMRVGPDSVKKWSGGKTNIIEGVRSAASVYFLNGRTWWIDPDSIYARSEKRFPDNEVRCFGSFVAVSGMLNNMTDWAPDYTPDRIDLLRRTMPSHQLTSVRPLDYFQNDPARIWHLTYQVGGETRHTLGLFNWTDEEIEISVPVADLGMAADARVHTFEFWSNHYQLDKGRIVRTLPRRSCLVLAVNPETRHPAVLGTNRHITQGAVDLVDLRWNKGILEGQSRVVRNDPYVIRIANNGARLKHVSVSAEDGEAGVTAELKQGGDVSEVTIRSPQNRTVHWQAE